MSPTPKRANKKQSSAPDLMTMVGCAWRHRWVVLFGGCVLAGLGASAGQFMIPARFKATAMVRLSAPNGVVERPNESSIAQRDFRSTQQELVKMPHVLQRALESPRVRELNLLGTDPDAAAELASWLQVELPRSSEILRISLQHDRADCSYLLVNAVTDAYLQEVQRSGEEEMRKRLAVLDRLHAATENRLARAWSDLQALARQLGSGDPTALSLQAQAEIENYRDYSRRLRTLRAEKRDAERTVRSIEEAPEMLTKEMPEDASMHSVKYAMFRAKFKREEALTKWGPNHPDVLAAEREENLLREYYQKSSSEEVERPKSRQEQILAEPLATIARLANEETALESMIREIDDRVQVLGGDNASKLEVLRNDIARMERLSDRLWQTRENLQVERHADQRVQLVSYANLPSRRDASKRSKLTMVLALGGFVFAVGLSSFTEFLTGRLHSARDVTQRTSLEVMADLPRLPERLGDLSDESTPRAERITRQLDMLVARLTTHPTLHEPRVILVTAAHGRKERDGLAPHLAQSLARTGHPTILVDLDLREPATVTRTPRTPAVAVADFVLASRDWASADLSSGVSRLDYLPAGEGTTEPLPVLTHPRLGQLLEAFRQRYSYVVIETAGVLEFPDAVHISRHVDLALLPIQRNVSVANQVGQTQERLSEIGRPVFGAFLA